MTQATTTKWVYGFDEPVREGIDARDELGGKGASLNAMRRAGLRVPPGFTISTAACAAFFDTDQRWPDGLEAQVRQQLHKLEADTGRRFGQGSEPLLVSVRSGAAVSMPGMMDTILNCGLHERLADEVGDTPAFWTLYQQFLRSFARIVHHLPEDALPAVDASREGTHKLIATALSKHHVTLPTDPWDTLMACINAVFNSWQSDRAKAYRHRHDIRGLGGTAVNVQAMFPSQVSGVAFTQDPTSPAADRIVIEAAFGLGESVVSGEVTPDRWVVDRDSRRILNETIGHKASAVYALGQASEVEPDAPSLTHQQVRELTELALNVEAHFGHPVDIEWGLVHGGFALLQSRAIRGIEVARDVEVARQHEIDRLRALAAGRKDSVWVEHNLGETLRAPTPLTWDVMQRFMSGRGGFGNLYRLLGYRPSPKVHEAGFLELIAGRIYADPQRVVEMFFEAMPLRYDIDALRQDKTLLDRVPTQFDAHRADGRFLFKLPANLWSMVRAGRRFRKLQRHARDRLENTVLPPFLAWVRQETARDLSTMNDAALLELFRERQRRVLDEFAPESLLPAFVGAVLLGRVEARLQLLLGEDAGRTLTRTLTQGLEGDMTIEQDTMLYDVAQGDATLDDFIDKFGHRAIGEMELATPRWRENRQYLEQTVQRLRQTGTRSPRDIHHKAAARRKEAEAALFDTLKAHGGASFYAVIRAELDRVQSLLPYRETGKYHLMRGYALLRDVTEELARRWGLGSDLYFLQLDELSRFTVDAAALQSDIPARRIRWQAFQRLDMSAVIDASDLDSLGKPPAPDGNSDQLQGTAMAPGVATGPVRIVHDPNTVGDLGHGYVLVCGSTDPGWTPLFMQAAAVVVERGGVLSHGAIVARDFGIPAVACPHATTRLQEGDTIKVDGNEGRIDVLTRAQAGSDDDA